MRDNDAFSRRFFGAIAALSATVAAGCEATSTSAGAIPAADTTGGLVDIAADGTDGTDGTAATDGTDGTDGTDATDGTDGTDGGDAEDVWVAPDVIPAADVATPDTEVPDIYMPDGDIGHPNDAGEAPDVLPVEDVGSGVCEFGGAPTVTCLTASEIEAIINNPPFGGKPGAAYLLPPEGCPDPSLVPDGCCNPPAGPGELSGETCCYSYCTGACCGRPLQLEGVARVAPVVSRGEGWRDLASAVDAAAWQPVAQAHRAALAAAWRADAQDEHASIASFQRFGLDLLALGAPSALVTDALSAAGDEVRHARIAFGVAASLDGQHLGPGSLELGALRVRGDLAEAAVAAVYEGCVGETLAAVTVSTAARLCTVPELARQLQLIADDEARHAELAWRFVTWAARSDAKARRAVAQAFAQTLAAGAAPDPREALLQGVPDAARRAAGRLPAGESARLWQRALTDIVAPNADALLAEALRSA